MKQKLFDSSIRPACIYCTVGKATEDKEHILCVKKGVMQPDSSCRHFVYDPLRREPQAKPKMETYDASAFSLE